MQKQPKAENEKKFSHSLHEVKFRGNEKPGFYPGSI